MVALDLILTCSGSACVILSLSVFVSVSVLTKKNAENGHEQSSSSEESLAAQANGFPYQLHPAGS